MFASDSIFDHSGGVSLENLTWLPLIEWSDNADVYVRRLNDTDDATNDANTRIEDVGDDFIYPLKTENSVGIEVHW